MQNSFKHSHREKPWGHEILLTDPSLPYAAKYIHIHADKRLSLQYHDQKTESVTLVEGSCLLLLEDAEIDMQPGVTYSVQIGQKHRLIAKTDTTILEISTPEKGTTFRLEDDYNRQDEVIR